MEQKYPVVIVEWNDAFELPSRDWYSIEEMQKRIPLDKKGEPCITIGYKIQDTDDHIVLSQTVQPDAKPDEPSLSGLMFIPRGMIQKITEVAE